MDREIKQLKRSRIPIIKVRWNSKRGPEFTWECEDEIHAKYPHLFSIITSSSIKSRDEISSIEENVTHEADYEAMQSRPQYYYSEDQYAVSIKEDTAYPCLHSPKTIEDKAQYAVSRETQYAIFKIWNEYNILEDIKRGPYSKKSPIRRIQLLGYAYDPNKTIEYIRLEEEKARRRGKVYNWETATYGKIWDNEDVHGLRSVETEFPSVVFKDTLTSEATLSCEPTVSSLNDNKIDFRISFVESDDEDCMVIFVKNSFSYKIIYVNDLKTDSENDNDKVNIPLLPSPEPTVNYFDDLDFFKDFENEFSAIVYNDAQTSKSDLLTEPILNPQHIDEFNLKDETSLSEYDEEEQNV
ncbi:hypothetical protein Tco_0913032 [Tanacetum coccineum]